MDVSRLWLWLACSVAGGALYLLLRAHGAPRKWLVPSASTVFVVAAAAIAIDVLQPLSSPGLTLLWSAAAAAAVGGLVLMLTAQPAPLQWLGCGSTFLGASGLMGFAGSLVLSLVALCGAAAVAFFWFRKDSFGDVCRTRTEYGHPEMPQELLLSVFMWTLLTLGLLSGLETPQSMAAAPGGSLLSNQLACGSVLFATGLLIVLVATDTARRVVGLVAAHFGLLAFLLTWSQTHGQSGVVAFSVVVILLLVGQLALGWKLQSWAAVATADAGQELESAARES